MNAVLTTMNPITAMRLRMNLSWRSGGCAIAHPGSNAFVFEGIGLACDGVGEQRKGSRVSASGEAM